MLLNHHKHRAYRTSHAKSSSNDVTIWKLMKGDSPDPDPPEPEKTAEEQTSMRLEKALLDSRKELKVMKATEKRPQLVSLKGKSQFKKRVEDFYQRCDSITLQQKLNSLAPTTINNLTMIVTRNDPITTASFLATPYNKQTKMNQRLNTPSIQRNDASKLNQRFLLSRAASQQGYMLSEEEEDGRSEKFFIRPLEKHKTKKMTKNKSLSQEIIETLDRTGLQISSYNSIDKDIDALIDKNLNASMYQPKKNFVEYNKIKIEGNIESEPNFNFKVASTKNLDNVDSEFQPKEGSFLKHLRTQSVQPSLFPTKSQAAELSVKSHSNKNFAQKRTRSVQNNRNKNSNSSINNEETGLDVSNIFGSYRVPDSSKPLVSGKPMNSRHQRIIDSQDQVNNRMISPFLSGQVTQKSMLSIITPNKLNDNSHIEEELNISAIEYPEQNEATKLVSASNIQEVSLEDNNETITKPEDAKDQKENKLQNQIGIKTRTNTLQLQFCENPTMTRNLTELLSYAKQKSQILEDIIQHDIQDIKSMKKDTFSVEEAQAEARISYIQGGISQKTVKIDNIEREKDVPLLLEADTKEARAVREEVIKVNTKFESIEKKKEELYRQCKDKLEQAKMVAPQRLTNYEIYLIKNEFEKKPDNLDTEKIDLSLKKLRFFSQLSKEIRTNFYKNAQFFKFEKDDYIYRQGDSGDLMYVILRGNVNIKVDKMLEKGHPQLNPNYYTSLNDGYHFGDLAVIGEKYRTKQSQNSETKAIEAHDDKPGQRTTSIPEKLAALTKLMNQTLQKSWTSESKRKASSTQTLRQNSALCAEETEVIAIDRELFQEIIFSDAQKGLDAKIEVLQISYFFRGEESFNLMPIANILKTEKFKLGQRIIKAGDLIDNFYIVAKGRCKVISQIPDGYPLNLDMFKQKLRTLNFKTPKKTRKNKTENLNIQKPTETSLEKRIFDREPLIANGINNFSAEKSKKFVKHIKHKELARGDCFGIRSLLKAGDDDSSTVDDKCLIAKLSVVADTSDVEVYVLPRISLILVPEEIRNNLLNLIAETNDFDELDTSEDIIEHRQWRKYQLGIIKRALTKTDDTNLSLVHTTYKAT